VRTTRVRSGTSAIPRSLLANPPASPRTSVRSGTTIAAPGSVSVHPQSARRARSWWVTNASLFALRTLGTRRALHPASSGMRSGMGRLGIARRPRLVSPQASPYVMGKSGAPNLVPGRVSVHRPRRPVSTRCLAGRARSKANARMLGVLGVSTTRGASIAASRCRVCVSTTLISRLASLMRNA